MTDGDARRELERLAEQARELEKTHRDLRAQRAAASDFSAQVHDEAARVHEKLGERSLLDVEALRAHADEDRAIAAQERAALRREPDAD